MTEWKCPECGAPANHHGRGGLEKCEYQNASKMSCPGFLCECEDHPADGDHGTEKDPCEDARCYHCGWTGTFPQLVESSSSQCGLVQYTCGCVVIAGVESPSGYKYRLWCCGKEHRSKDWPHPGWVKVEDLDGVGVAVDMQHEIAATRAGYGSGIMTGLNEMVSLVHDGFRFREIKKVLGIKE